MSFEDIEHGYWIYMADTATWWRALNDGSTDDLTEAHVYSLEELRAIRQNQPGFAGPGSALFFVPALPLQFDALEGLNDIVEHVSGRAKDWQQEQKKAAARKKVIV